MDERMQIGSIALAFIRAAQNQAWKGYPEHKALKMRAHSRLLPEIKNLNEILAATHTDSMFVLKERLPDSVPAISETVSLTFDLYFTQRVYPGFFRRNTKITTPPTKIGSIEVTNDEHSLDQALAQLERLVVETVNHPSAIKPKDLKSIAVTELGFVYSEQDLAAS